VQQIRIPYTYVPGLQCDGHKIPKIAGFSEGLHLEQSVCTKITTQGQPPGETVLMFLQSSFKTDLDPCPNPLYRVGQKVDHRVVSSSV